MGRIIFDRKLNNYFQKTLVVLLCMTMSLACLTGCAVELPFPVMQSQNVVKQTKAEDENATLGETPDLDYLIPVQTSNIETSEYGYVADGEKYAVFLGADLEAGYRLISVDDHSEVFRGQLKDLGLFASSGEPIYLADFSSYTKEGSYYLEHDKIGQSYPFEIRDGIYEELFRASMREIYLNRCGISLPMEFAGSQARNACHTMLANSKSTSDLQFDVSGGWHTSADGSRDVSAACEDVALFLLAFRYCSLAFDDANGIPESGNDIPDLLDEVRYETDWLLKMQEPKSGAVYSGVSVMTRAGSDNLLILEDPTVEASLAFAAALARFSYLYQSYDSAYATTCIQAADRAMKYVKSVSSEITTGYFWAAAEMYRATGYFNYKQIVDTFFLENTSYDLKDYRMLQGGITYLDTTQKTDLATCTSLINALRQEAENISLSASTSLYGSLGTEDEELFRQSLILLIVNYVISSNEYETILERYAQYFLGCNTTGTVSVTDTSEQEKTDGNGTILGGLTSGLTGNRKTAQEWSFEPSALRADWTVLLSGIVSYSKKMEE